MAKLLVVEDDEIMLELITSALQEQGHEVIQAGHGEEVIPLAKSEKPDLIILDMYLPGILGWDLAPKIRADHEISNIPIIGLSAETATTAIEETHGAGCDRFHSKPIDFKSLSDTIAELLTR